MQPSAQIASSKRINSYINSTFAFGLLEPFCVLGGYHAKAVERCVWLAVAVAAMLQAAMLLCCKLRGGLANYARNYVQNVVCKLLA